jgi:hypothetical protein
MSVWDRLGLVPTALAFVFLSANTWLEPGRHQKKLMDVCDAVYQSRGEMLKDQNWDLERLTESRDLSSKAYGLCLDRTVAASQSKYEDPPSRWDEKRRALLRAELDAWYARAYGLTRDELRYILDPADDAALQPQCL